MIFSSLCSSPRTPATSADFPEVESGLDIFLIQLFFFFFVSAAIAGAADSRSKLSNKHIILIMGAPPSSGDSHQHGHGSRIPPDRGEVYRESSAWQGLSP